MTLTAEHRVLFCLLRAGLWEREADDLSAFPLTDTQWREVYRLAVQHTVAGIVWRGLHHLPDSLLPGDALMIRWVTKVTGIERQNLRMNATIGALIGLMEANGLHPVLMKGQGVAALYARPLMRQCGDIDLYFPSHKEEKEAAGLMRANGCTMEKRPDGSRCYKWHGVEIEHHTRLFDLHTPWLRGYLNAMVGKHGFARQTIVGEQAHDILVLTPLPNLLLLSAHMLKHLMGNGIGLRQFCDIAKAYHTLRGRYSSEELEAAYRRTGLLRWNRQLHAFLTEYIGLAPNDIPCAASGTVTSPRLLDIVLEGGNFGQYRENGDKALHAGWERKWWTLLSFWKHRDFSYAYAPREAFWTYIRLIIGNLR